MKKVLITGGLGYIGAHTATLFLQQGYEVIIADNLGNSSMTTLHEITEITGKTPSFYEVDMRDLNGLDKMFGEHPNIDVVVHFAALKSVGESTNKPYLYYDNNINGTIRLLYMMDKYKISKFIFSSTAAVYDQIKNIPPFVENDRCKTINPYGTTKLIIENVLKDVAQHKFMNSIALRYFNVVGAHESGLLGDNPAKPTNLLQKITEVLNNQQEHLEVYGEDYETKDGSCVRDFIHVDDIARAHLLAYEYLTLFEESHAQNDDHEQIAGLHEIFNLSTGDGVSVIKFIEMVEKVTDRKIPYTITDRRKGDIPVAIGNPKKAKKVLGRQSQKSVHQAIVDHWNFINKHK